MDDRVTFEEKVGGALDALFTGALVLTRDPARAEALVVGVVAEAFQSRARGSGEFRHWIVGRMVSRYVEHASERATPDRAPEAGRDEEGGRSVAEGAGLDLENLVVELESLETRDPDRLASLIRAGLRGLPLLERAAVWLVTVMGFSYEEAGSVLGIDRSDVRGRVLRGRHELQLRLAPALHEAVSGDAAPGDSAAPPRAGGDG